MEPPRSSEDGGSSTIVIQRTPYRTPYTVDPYASRSKRDHGTWDVGRGTWDVGRREGGGRRNGGTE